MVAFFVDELDGSSLKLLLLSYVFGTASHEKVWKVFEVIKVRGVRSYVLVSKYLAKNVQLFCRQQTRVTCSERVVS